jgi:hypothetical protein
VAVDGTGKIWRPEHAESLVESGAVDLVGMARQLLADPDWPKKVRDGHRDAVVCCEYGNVCKALDENFQRVRCTLWPKDALHAPRSLVPMSAPPPRWPGGDAALQARYERGRLRLDWRRAEAISEELYGYEIFRGEAGPDAPLPHHATVRAATPTFLDTEVLGGKKYAYAVAAYDRRGVRGPRSSVLEVSIPSD